VWRPNNVQWWIFVVAALLVVFVWPPAGGKSLALKFVNWAVDPGNELPTLPDQLALGLGDDPDAVYEHDLQTQQYDALYEKGGWARRRLELKVATDPFDPATERQVLAGVVILIALIAWRFGGERTRN